MVKTRRILLSLLSAGILTMHAGAQVSSHQRLGVESKDIADVNVGVDLSLSPAFNGGYQGLELDPTATLDIVVQRSFSLSLSLPVSGWLDLDGRGPAVAALGDPGVALGYSLRAGDWRLGVSGSYQHPLGIWNYYEVEERHIASSSGFRILGLDLSATRYLDPLIAGVRLSARSDLERRGQFATSSRPLRIILGLSATEALNEIVALSVSLSNEADSPWLVNGQPQFGGWGYSLSGSAGLVFSSDIFSFRIGISKTLSESGSLPRFEASASYTFKIKGRS